MKLILNMNKRYTYADYLTWFDEKRRELINGFIRVMSAPSTLHADVTSAIFWYIKEHIIRNKGKCKVFSAPFDVRLPTCKEKGDDKIYTVVQPDICVVCDLSKLDYRGCIGAPEMVVEVISPSTSRYDHTKKFDLYEASGVREYWIADPGNRSVAIYLLQPDGKYDEGTIYEYGADKIPVNVINGLSLDWKSIFTES
ncbi:MAG: Uma2 family endonuclease [Bacteroidales bacterium]|nr:Uma2 family endonuclease [Bacteroidales bacterium]